MTSEGACIANDRAIAELWISFTSLLRSYVAVLQIVSGNPAVEVTDFDAERFELRAQSRVLRMVFNAATARGSWEMHAWPLVNGSEALQTGTFAIGDDGHIFWSTLPGAVEMDRAAEAVATMVAA